jgi:oligopeptide transport system substrate-binding protein
VSKDGLTYTVDLKPNLKWSNGDKLTAQDFVYSWQRAVDPATASGYAYLVAGAVANAQKINSMKTATQADLDTLGIKANSDTEFTVTLAQPTPYFEMLLAEPVYYPLDPNVVKNDGKSFGTNSSKMVYDGPFMFKSTNSWNGTSKTFSIYKNPNYWDASHVKSNEIDFQVVTNTNTGAQLYKSGKLDFALLSTPTVINANKGEKGFTVYKQARTDYIEYNQTGSVPALNNQDIREALNLATDRSAVVSTALPYSNPATSFSPAGFAKTNTGQDFSSYVKQNYSYDTTKAQQLWSEGLKQLGLKSLTLSFEYASDLAPSTATANYLQTAWEKALPGLTINTKGVPFTQRLNDQTSQNFQVILVGWGGDYAEPTTFLNLFVTNGSFNDGKFSSSAYDAAYTAATTTDVLNASKRFADYKTCEDILYQNSYINPVVFEANPALVNPNLVGLQFHSTGLAYDLKEAYLK